MKSAYLKNITCIGLHGLNITIREAACGLVQDVNKLSDTVVKAVCDGGALALSSKEKEAYSKDILVEHRRRLDILSEDIVLRFRVLSTLERHVTMIQAIDRDDTSTTAQARRRGELLLHTFNQPFCVRRLFPMVPLNHFREEWARSEKGLQTHYGGSQLVAVKELSHISRQPMFFLPGSTGLCLRRIVFVPLQFEKETSWNEDGYKRLRMAIGTARRHLDAWKKDIVRAEEFLKNMLQANRQEFSRQTRSKVLSLQGSLTKKIGSKTEASFMLNTIACSDMVVIDACIRSEIIGAKRRLKVVRQRLVEYVGRNHFEWLGEYNKVYPALVPCASSVFDTFVSEYHRTQDVYNQKIHHLREIQRLHRRLAPPDEINQNVRQYNTLRKEHLLTTPVLSVTGPRALTESWVANPHVYIPHYKKRCPSHEIHSFSLETVMETVLLLKQDLCELQRYYESFITRYNVVMSEYYERVSEHKQREEEKLSRETDKLECKINLLESLVCEGRACL